MLKDKLWSSSISSYYKAGSSLDPATSTWIAAVISAGGTVSGTQTTRVDTFIKALKTAPNGNLFNIMDRVWLFAGESQAHQAQIDVINLGVATLNGTITLSSIGYTGDGSTGYLDTSYIPRTGGGHFSQNSASMFGYINSVTGLTKCVLGCTDTLGSIYDSIAVGLNVAELNGGSFPTYNPNSNGLFVSSRIASTGFTVYQNVNGGTTGSSPATTPLTDTSGTMPNNKMFISAQCNNAGAATNFASDPILAVGFGGGLTANNASDFSIALNAYMISWGVNNYS